MLHNWNKKIWDISPTKQKVLNSEHGFPGTSDTFNITRLSSYNTNPARLGPVETNQAALKNWRPNCRPSPMANSWQLVIDHHDPSRWIVATKKHRGGYNKHVQVIYLDKCIFIYIYIYAFIFIYIHLNFILHIYIYTQYDICVCIQYTSFFKMTLFGPISDLNLGNQKVTLKNLVYNCFVCILYIYIISYQTRVALGCPGLRRERIKSIYYIVEIVLCRMLTPLKRIHFWLISRNNTDSSVVRQWFTGSLRLCWDCSIKSSTAIGHWELLSSTELSGAVVFRNRFGWINGRKRVQNIPGKQTVDGSESNPARKPPGILGCKQIPDKYWDKLPTSTG